MERFKFRIHPPNKCYVDLVIDADGASDAIRLMEARFSRCRVSYLGSPGGNEEDFYQKYKFRVHTTPYFDMVISAFSTGDAVTIMEESYYPTKVSYLGSP